MYVYVHLFASCLFTDWNRDTLSHFSWTPFSVRHREEPQNINAERATVDNLKFNPFMFPVKLPGLREVMQHAQGKLVAGLGPESEPWCSQKFTDEIQPPGTTGLGLGIIIIVIVINNNNNNKYYYHYYFKMRSRYDSQSTLKISSPSTGR